jgi:hypothetical protein
MLLFLITTAIISLIILSAFQYCSSAALVGLLLLGTTATAQTTPVPKAVAPKPEFKMLDGQKVYQYVEKMPVYLDGGMEGLQNFIASHVTGGAASGSRSYVSFIIDQTGNVRNPVFGGSSAEEAAAAELALASAFASIGKFRPGYQNGKPVNVELTLPIVKRQKK